MNSFCICSLFCVSLVVPITNPNYFPNYHATSYVLFCFVLLCSVLPSRQACTYVLAVLLNGASRYWLEEACVLSGIYVNNGSEADIRNDDLGTPSAGDVPGKYSGAGGKSDKNTEKTAGSNALFSGVTVKTERGVNSSHSDIPSFPVHPSSSSSSTFFAAGTAATATAPTSTPAVAYAGSSNSFGHERVQQSIVIKEERKGERVSEPQTTHSALGQTRFYVHPDPCSKSLNFSSEFGSCSAVFSTGKTIYQNVESTSSTSTEIRSGVASSSSNDRTDNRCSGRSNSANSSGDHHSQQRRKSVESDLNNASKNIRTGSRFSDRKRERSKEKYSGSANSEDGVKERTSNREIERDRARESESERNGKEPAVASKYSAYLKNLAFDVSPDDVILNLSSKGLRVADCEIIPG